MALGKLSSGPEMEHSDFPFYGATKMATLVSFVCLFVCVFSFSSQNREERYPNYTIDYKVVINIIVHR